MPYTTNSVQITGGGHYRSRQATASSKTYTANGALSMNTGTHLLAKTSAGAFTIDAPKANADGQVVRIVATTAFAHTVTLTKGFNNSNTAGDVATFGGAIGDSMTLVASADGNWYTTNLRNVVLS